MKIALFNLLVLVVTATAFGQARVSSGPCINYFGQSEWAALLDTAPPETKTKFIEEAEFRKLQSESLRELFAHACDAVRRGIHLEKTNAVELKNIQAETVAVAYDREITKQKPGLPFARVTPEQIEKFYESRLNVSAFDQFLAAKIELLKKAGSPIGERGPNDEEKQQAREFFAKVKITEGEYLRSRTVTTKLRSRAELQARLQQAEFLARLTAEKLAPSVTVTDTEVDAYIARHPDLDASKKREVAVKLLERAKAGEDFAALANQYTQDPGNDGNGGVKQGGLYSGIKKGVFVPSFEKAALSLEAGKIYPTLVETDFGYHIIKLEKTTGAGDDLQYDARHILISTGFKDPKDPSGRDVPVKTFARSKLQAEKEAAATNKIIAANRVTVEEYALPKPAVKKRPVRRRR